MIESPVANRREDQQETSAAQDVLFALHRLDELLGEAVSHSDFLPGSSDSFRGLRVSQEEARSLLARDPGLPLFGSVATTRSSRSEADHYGPIAWLQRAFGLTPFDVDVLLIALAPELDLKYERLFAYLQGGTIRFRPSIDLALNLLCGTALEKVERRSHFGAQAPLIRHDLVRLLPDPHQSDPPLLSHSLKVDEQIVGLLLGSASIDSRLSASCKWIEPLDGHDAPFLPDEAKSLLPRLVEESAERNAPLRLYFQGERGSGKFRMAQAVAAQTRSPLLAANLTLMAGAPDFDRALRLVYREAWFRNAFLYWEGMDGLREEGRSFEYNQFMSHLCADGGITIMAGTRPWLPAGPSPTAVMTVRFTVPAPPQRYETWRNSLRAAGVTAPPEELRTLAERFRLKPTQIEEAVAGAVNRARLRGVQSGLPYEVGVEDLFSSARVQSAPELGMIARRIEPVRSWGDLILTPDSIAQLRELCERAAHRQRVLIEWGFDGKLSMGKGANALFAGPSGTGKTLAAEVVAHELGLDLYKIDLAGMVSKYIGETEKNVDKIFTAAENANAVLFFDEADALFGKRSEVRDSHDRYANIEVSYLLQRMEQYEGIAILATNLRQNLDEAFVRRLAFAVHFPFPDESQRRQIWKSIWPERLPLHSDVDLDFLAAQFNLSGGCIKNIAIAAAYRAAAEGRSVTMDHLTRATEREFQKLGRAPAAFEQRTGLRSPVN